MSISPQDALDAVHRAAGHLAKIGCAPACALAEEPPMGPGTCHRCKASGVLYDLARDLERAIHGGAR